MSKPVVFISYSHKDEKEKDELVTQLRVLAGEFDLWLDDNIAGGDDWEQKIEDAIAKADLGIMLISANFLTSRFILNKEVPELLRRREEEGMRVFPVLAKSCVWQRIEWLAKFNVRPKNNEPVWGDKSKSSDGELAKIAEEIAKILEKSEDTKTLTSHLENFELPFTNRIDEIENVISISAPPYHIFDAPAGYGKTMLLQKIQTRFDEKKWLTALVNINGQQEKKDIILQLAKAFGLDSSKLKGDDPSRKFGSLLLGKWNLDLKNSKKGIVLLFDLKGMPSDNFGYIVNSLIPITRGILRENKFFSQNHNAFRVIFTGRYLSNCKVVSKSNVEFKIKKLAPFNLKVIQRTLSQYDPFKEMDEAFLSKMAADLIFITGGHPGCIAKIIELHTEEGGSIRTFVETNSNNIWDDIVKPLVDDIRAEIPLNLRGKLDTLSVLRRFDIPLLASMTEKYWASDVLDTSALTDDLRDDLLKDKTLELEKELLRTRLIDRNFSERILEDGITRRLLLIYLRQELQNTSEDDLMLKTRCSSAKEFCWKRIEDISLQGPEKWFTEYLFQDLQQHALDISDISQRQSEHVVFFDSTVPDALRDFVVIRGNDKWRDDKFALLDWIDKDWEFCFTVNYYLRGEQFSELPCEKLREMISEFDE